MMPEAQPVKSYALWSGLLALPLLLLLRFVPDGTITAFEASRSVLEGAALGYGLSLGASILRRRTGGIVLSAVLVLAFAVIQVIWLAPSPSQILPLAVAWGGGWVSGQIMLRYAQRGAFAAYPIRAVILGALPVLAFITLLTLYLPADTMVAEPLVVALALTAMLLHAGSLIGGAQVPVWAGAPLETALTVTFSGTLAFIVGAGLLHFADTSPQPIVLLLWPIGLVVAEVAMRADVVRHSVAALSVAAPAIMLPILMKTPGGELGLFSLLCFGLALGGDRQHPALSTQNNGMLQLIPAVRDFQDAALTWLAEVDANAKVVRFAPAARRQFGTRPQENLTTWLQHSSLPDVTAFLALVRTGTPDVPVQITLHLQHGSNGPIVPYAVHLLQRAGTSGLVALRQDAEADGLRSRCAELERRLEMMSLREERLLSLAAHELRTPVSVLSMLSEELKAGEPWEEIEPVFTNSLSRLISVLDDLRATGGEPLGMVQSSAFVARDITNGLLEDLGPSLAGRGVELVLRMPEDGSELARMNGDVARISLVLRRMLEAGLARPEVSRLTLVLMRPNASQFVWSLTSDGTPWNEKEIASLFTPFGGLSPTGSASEYEGLGLYTAKRAAALLGGQLSLLPAGVGYVLVFSHPVRSPATVAVTEA